MNWLKRRREELRLTQEDLARNLQLEGVSISRATIGHWETDRYEPPLHNEDLRKALAKILNLTPGELLQLAGFEVLNSTFSSAGQKAATLVDKMSPEEQQKALRILEALSS